MKSKLMDIKNQKKRDNVEIAIDKMGRLLLIDGRHRLTFAQILRLEKIPVIVNVISESLANSFTDEKFAESFPDRNIARAF